MNIGIYPGSFNAFHKGHYDVLLKAEKMFDKVIIARGINPEKAQASTPFPKILGDRTIMQYDGLLTDFIKRLEQIFETGKPTTFTVIRGLRNTTDFQYELTQYRYFQDLMPTIQMVSIFSDKEFDHVSSSGIRMLSGYSTADVSKYLLE